MTLSYDQKAVLAKVCAAQPVFWSDPAYHPAEDPQAQADLAQAVAAWRALAPALAAVFAQLGASGRIGSDLFDLTDMAARFGYKRTVGRLLVKGDHALPLAGSVKARGGVFEVFSVALRQAQEAGVIGPDDDPALLAADEARAFFAQRRISVGSTGNLGLSVGIAARALGYEVAVHMSMDAKPWKVQRLRDLGVTVVRHDSDYSTAVAVARAAALEDPLAHFVDDEDSQLLFNGYCAAAQELRAQLQDIGLTIGPDRPLVLHLPCGIGGAPGGIAYGARGAFGSHVHPFFAEPVQSPSALLQMMHGDRRGQTVYDFGLSNRTEADGMAVATMSDLVARKMRGRLAGVFTVGDEDLFRWLAAAQQAGLRLEPSAAAGFGGPMLMADAPAGQAFMRDYLAGVDPGRVVHVVWATGGAFVPEDQYQKFVERGDALSPEYDLRRTMV
ncbi:D-serine ammonia-lyase [Thioclava sp. SK-1]|uniref:D-serine ammonia-lyase n=1 Tax=Thioclava sp. SK-1 TaxID=1889770 RepID=UPI0008255898|nr:D-serine ammonia-lyase [Thioclava sp. SK-1]OCX60992.1 D-serine ammonia-lyase [Thioclava sp. SK-1]